MIIAVDFDDTLMLQTAAGKTVPNIRLMGSLAKEQASGNIVILWTCREGKMLEEAVRYCVKHGFRPNYVNQNAPEIIKRFGGDSRKIYADVYIDDRAVR